MYFKPCRSGRPSSSSSICTAPCLLCMNNLCLMSGPILAILVAVASVPSAHSAVCEPAAVLPRALLREEARLAREAHLYAIMDLTNRRVDLMAQGISVRRFSLQSFALIGEPWEGMGSVSLQEKRPSIEPDRVSPPLSDSEDETGVSHEPRPLNMAMMPTRYELVFNAGMSVLILPGGEKAPWQRVADLFHDFTQLVRAHTLVYWGRVRGVRRTFFLLRMTGDEAQAFYWAMKPPLALLLRGQVAC